LSESVSGKLTLELRTNQTNLGKAASEDFFTVFLSVCNKKERAKVFNGSSKTLSGAWANAERKLDEFLTKRRKAKEPMGITWAKADVVVSYEEINTVDLNKAVVKNRWVNFMRMGIAFDPQFKGSKTAFLENELNANKMIVYYSEREYNSRAFEYDANLLFLDNINVYRKKNYGLPPIAEVPERITLFTTRGFFCEEDESGKEVVHELYSDFENAGDIGRRRIDTVDGEEIKKVIVAASQFLANEIQPNGQFVYGYIPVFDNLIPTYNIVRHASSLWSIINLYRMSGDDSLIPKIESAIAYMEKEIEFKDENTAFLVERNADEIKLGGCGVAIIMLTEYMDVFKSDKYVDIVTKLANGILEMLNVESGEYWHVLSYPGFTFKDRYRIVYYDGEATFGLARAYTFTKDERFLDAAKAAVEHFIREDYTKHIDHWVAYSMLEVTKYLPEVRYYEFALRNVDNNMKDIYERETSFHTYLEMLMAAWQTYQRAIRDGIAEKSAYIKNYNPTYFAQTIYRRARHMLNGYFFPECAMYMKSPEKIAGAFMVRHHSFRTRIDDVQHFIGGYYFYSVLYDEIAAHLTDDFIRGLDKSPAILDYNPESAEKVASVAQMHPPIVARVEVPIQPRTSNSPVIFYGILNEALVENNLSRWIQIAGAVPVLFCEKNRNLHKFPGKFLGRFEVVSLDDALARYPDAEVWVTYRSAAITAQYLNLKMRPEKVHFLEADLEHRKGCRYLGHFISYRKDSFSPCCVTGQTPVIATEGPIRDRMAQWQNYTSKLVDDVRNGKPNDCQKCPLLKPGFYPRKVELTEINFGSNQPGDICNFKCVYCFCAKNLERLKTATDGFTTYEVLKQLSEMPEYDNDKFIVQLANGEFCANKHHNEMLDILLKTKWQITLLSNFSLYREKLAELMETGRIKRLLISIDAGTRETFKQVKGNDRFEYVLEHLRKYPVHRTSLRLKYVFIEDMNDNETDIDGFYEIAKEHNATIILSSDLSKLWTPKMRELATRIINKAKSDGIKISSGSSYLNRADVKFVNEVYAE
jgi:uncharacterized Fe-S cluster-containing radical SAM superfamily protein